MRTPHQLTLLFALVVAVTGCSQRIMRQNQNSAMSPSIQSREIIVVDLDAYRKAHPQRWDVVAFHPPSQPLVNEKDIWNLRVIGLPGETLAIDPNGIVINGVLQKSPDRVRSVRYALPIAFNMKRPPVSFPYTVPENSYFLLGDNTANSFDSRYWGALPATRIVGKIRFK